LRRGASDDEILHAFGMGETPEPTRRGALAPAQRAAVELAEAMSRVPATLGAEQRASLAEHFSAADAEWIMLTAAMMGFLNKFLDAVGVDLENNTVGEVRSLITPAGWAAERHLRGVKGVEDVPRPAVDSLGLKLGLVLHAPHAISMDRRWTKGVPTSAPAVGRYLEEHTGEAFPVLAKLKHGRAVRALATMLRDNLTPGDTHVGLRAKHLAGLVYAAEVRDGEIERIARKLSSRGPDGAPAAAIDEVARFAAEPLALHDADAIEEAASRLASVEGIGPACADALLLAKAASPSPSLITPAMVERCAARLAPEVIVELLVWLSVLQTLHRLDVFFDVGGLPS
jgi:hypothetical protein